MAQLWVQGAWGTDAIIAATAVIHKLPPYALNSTRFAAAPVLSATRLH
jgi:hypothetical protein